MEKSNNLEMECADGNTKDNNEQERKAYQLHN